MRLTFSAIYLSICLIIFALVPGLVAGDEGGDTNQPSQEFQLLGLINQARANPLGVAAALGLDPLRVLADLPGLSDILTQGIGPLRFNENLYVAARSHTRDMLDNNFYSHDSMDGRTYEDRIRESGYDPVAAGETLGLLAFSNFVDPEEAVNAIFENMFLGELDPFRTERRNILAPDLLEAGISFGTGAMDLGGSSFNVYLATCNFGAVAAPTELLETPALQLLQLINQARARPLDMAASLGLDPDGVLVDLPGLYYELTGGLPPLGLNDALHTAAQAHTEDMLDNDFYGHDSPDGRTYEDRIMDAGYDPASTGESLGAVNFSDFADSPEAVKGVFECMFLDELDPARVEKRNILAPDLKEVGIGFGSGSLKMEGTLSNAYAATCDFGAGMSQDNPYLVGVVYRDLNHDGLYDPGEGVDETPIIVYGAGLHLKTDSAGGFGALLAEGGYQVIHFGETEPMEIRELFLGEENTSVIFTVNGL